MGRRLRGMRIALSLFVVAACEPASTPAPRPALGAPVQKVSLADVGLESAALDRTSDPCVDFYQFACGGWLKANDIPADRARWGRFTEIDEHNKTAIKTLLEDDAKAAATDPSAKKLGDFYASCMDEATIDKAGTASIKPLLDKATKIKDAKSWSAALGEFHKAGIRVVWRIGASPDLKDSTTNLTDIDSGGLGLPDRDYYVVDKFKSKLDAYKLHVGKMLALVASAGGGSKGSADDVLVIETELAKVTKTGVERRDVPASYNPTDIKGLGKAVSSIDWKAYFKAIDVTPSAKINVGTPKYLAAIDGLRKRFTPAQWSSYFTYHLAQSAAPALPKVFDDEAFELEKLTSGVEKQPDRFKRCIDATTRGLGELLGKQYADKYFPPSSKATATTLVEAIFSSMHDDLQALDWMSEQTRPIAIGKLAKIVKMIGYPEKWKTYEFAVKRDDYAGNVLRATAFETHRQRAKAGKPYDRSEWQMNSFTVNAYYEPSANNTALPAGILQIPFFGPDRSVGVNLGGIGMVIGHELTHGFDDQGAQFDLDGNLKNWWQPDDKTKFDAKATCVADQYSTFEALKGQTVNGRLTLGENIADLGGVKMAFNAYRTLRKNADKQIVADGFTEDQQFFLSVGQAWCSKDRPAEIQRRLTVDPHSPPKFRVFGALRNLPEFSAAFSCPAGTPMHPAKTCSVW
jgi:putative endopeptidase